MEKIYILWGTLKIGVKWHGHIIWHFLWLFHSLSTFPHSTAVTPTTSVSQYLGQEKQKESSMWNPKLIIWKPSMFFLFQTITDAGRWSVRERQHQNNWVCVCACSPGFALTWLTLEIDGLQELQCYWMQYYQYTPVRLTGCFIPGTLTSTEHPLQQCLLLLCSNHQHNLPKKCLISALVICLYHFI